jgi:hypothetical protein
MNKAIMNAVGFAKEVKAVEEGLCPLCKQQIKADSFRDELSIKEFVISGMCQSCQDDVFGGE